MPLFNKTSADYWRFSRGVLIATLVVGVARMGLSLAGANGVARWVSLTALTPIIIVYLGIRVHTSGFGSYKQLLVPIFLQGVLSQWIVGIGIAFTAVTSIATIYSPVQMPSGASPWGHAAAHFVGGPIFALIQWIPAVVILAITKLVVRKPITGV